MVKDDMRTANIALYVHGPGGYQNALDTISLLVNYGKVGSGARKGLETYKDTGAIGLVSQVLVKAKSTYNKILIGDISGALNDLNQAISLMKQAEDAERTASMIRDITTVAIPIIVVVVVVLLLKKRKK